MSADANTAGALYCQCPRSVFSHLGTGLNVFTGFGMDKLRLSCTLRGGIEVLEGTIDKLTMRIVIAYYVIIILIHLETFSQSAQQSLERLIVRSTVTNRIQAGLSTVLVAILFTLVTTVANAAPSIVLEKGHTDIFNVRAEGDQLVLNLKEDITGQHVIQQPENVLLVVKESAHTQMTANVPQVGTPGYYLPMTQDFNLLWPGWDTLEVQESGFYGIDINFVQVNGPGRVFLFSQSAFGAPEALLKDGSFELKTGSVREQSFPAHTHAHWVFEKPGTYTMVVNASGAKDGKTVVSNTATYTWRVGDIPEVDPQPTAPSEPVPSVEPEPTTEPVPSAEPEPTTEPVPSVEPEPVPSNEGESAVPSQQAPQPSATTSLQATCFPKQVGGSGSLTIIPKMKDDRSAPALWRDPQTVPFLLGNAAKTTTTQAVGSIAAGTPVWMIGATQVSGVPWLGANTMNESVLKQTTGEVTWQLTSFSGPGSMEVFTSGNFGQVVGHKWFSNAGGSVTIPRNTHVHPNWVFTRAGTYRVGLKQTAKLTDGTTVSGTTTLTFNVGTGSGVSDGHFDLGSEIGAAGARTVWQDKDGNPCTPTAADYAAAGLTPPGTLPLTGADSTSLYLAVFALGIAVLGAGILRYRQVL